MIVHRWLAPRLPDRQQLARLMEIENLNPEEEVCEKGKTFLEHRHPFAEVRVVVSGELVMKIAGNQILLREGDKIEIPANTRHSFGAHGEHDCICLRAERVI